MPVYDRWTTPLTIPDCQGEDCQEAATHAVFRAPTGTDKRVTRELVGAYCLTCALWTEGRDGDPLELIEELASP